MAYAVTSIRVAYLVGRSDHTVRAVVIVITGVQVVLLSAGTLLIMTAAGADGGSVPLGDPTLFSTGSYSTRYWPSWITPAAGWVFDDSAHGRRLRIPGDGRWTRRSPSAEPGHDPGRTHWALLDRYLLPPFVTLGLVRLITTLLRNVPSCRDEASAGWPPSVALRCPAMCSRTRLPAHCVPNWLGPLCEDVDRGTAPGSAGGARRGAACRGVRAAWPGLRAGRRGHGKDAHHHPADRSAGQCRSCRPWAGPGRDVHCPGGGGAAYPVARSGGSRGAGPHLPRRGAAPAALLLAPGGG